MSSMLFFMIFFSISPIVMRSSRRSLGELYKQTGSHEQASYAIQDTPKTIPSTTAASCRTTSLPSLPRCSTKSGPLRGSGR